uniref:Uncharacterized protein n=1 Tax=Amphimedon queenslandica TaxID=400682 RepID=A0A1X7V4M9_AMPQE
MEDVVNKLNEICNTLSQLEDHLLTVSSLPNVTSSASPEQKLLLDAVILLGSITKDWNKQCSDNMQNNSNCNSAYEIHTILYNTVTDIDKILNDVLSNSLHILEPYGAIEKMHETFTIVLHLYEMVGNCMESPQL